MTAPRRRARHSLRAERGNNERLVEMISRTRDIAEDLELSRFAAERESMSRAADELTQVLFDSHDVDTGGGNLQVAVIGDFNAGKSSFINSLMGYPICPVDVCPTTSSVSYFQWANTLNVFQRLDHGQRSACSIEDYGKLVRHPRSNPSLPGSCLEFDVHFPLELLRDLTLVDTPGFHSAENAQDSEITRRVALDSDVILYVVDITLGALAADAAALIRELKASPGRSTRWCLVLNCVDRKSPAACQRIAESIRDKHLDLFDAPPWLYSSKWAMETNPSAERSWLQLVRLHIERDATARAPLRLAVTGEKQGSGGAYVVTVGDEKRFVRSDAASCVLDAPQMLINLRALAGDKMLILRGRAVQQREQAKARLVDLISQVARQLNERDGALHTTSSRAATAAHDSIEALLHPNSQLRTALLRVLANVTRARALTNEEKPYWKTPYAILTVSKDALSDALQRAAEFRLSEQVGEIFKEHNLLEGEDSGLAESLSQIDRLFVDGLVARLSGDVFDAFDSQYEDLDGAKRALVALQELSAFPEREASLKQLLILTKLEPHMNAALESASNAVMGRVEHALDRIATRDQAIRHERASRSTSLSTKIRELGLMLRTRGSVPSPLPGE